MRAVPLAIALVSLLVFVPQGNALEPKGETIPWNILDCQFVYAAIEVPAARLSSRTPPGFRLYAQSTVTANQVATFALEANVCSEGSGLSGQVEPMTYVSTWSPTTAPPLHAVPGVFTVLNWDPVVPDADRRAWLNDAGTPAHDGDVEFGVDFHAGRPLVPFTVDYTIDGIGDFHFDIAYVRDLPAAGGEFAQYTVGGARPQAYWRTNWATQAGYAGVGMVTVPEGSWHAEVLGGTQAPARFHYGLWEYTDGKIVIPN